LLETGLMLDTDGLYVRLNCLENLNIFADINGMKFDMFKINFHINYHNTNPLVMQFIGIIIFNFIIIKTSLFLKIV